MTAEFRRGIDKVNEIAQRSNFTGGKNRFFNWDGGETKVLRFLTEGDQIALAAMHEFVPCHDGKKRSFVCRREVSDSCELCERDDVKKREQAFAVAVWREPTKKDGKTVYKTKTEEVEVEEDGKTVTRIEPWVGIVRQAPKNFWGWFYEAFDKSGTLLDRDYSITRRGKDKQTTYQPYPEDKQELDLSKFEKYTPDLAEFLSWQASEEYYDRYLRGVVKEDKDDSEDSELTAEDLEALQKANEEVAASAASGEFD